MRRKSRSGVAPKAGIETTPDFILTNSLILVSAYVGAHSWALRYALRKRPTGQDPILGRMFCLQLPRIPFAPTSEWGPSSHDRQRLTPICVIYP
jgi:hypothetical protein